MFAIFEDIGMSEILVIGVFGVLLFGKRLPEVASQAGQQLVKFRRSLQQVKAESGMDQEVRKIQRTIQEAIPQLGWSQGTLAGRLARGRNLLAQRRANRGVVRSAGSLAAVVSQPATSAVVPTARMSSPVKAAALIAAGPATVAGVVPAQVALRTEGALKAGRSSAGWGVCQLPKPSRSPSRHGFGDLACAP